MAKEICGFCKQPTEVGWTYCPYCGSQRREMSVEAPPAHLLQPAKVLYGESATAAAMVASQEYNSRLRSQLDQQQVHAKVEARHGLKLDAGKPPVYQGVIRYFPRALEEIAVISAAGTAAPGHVWDGWKTVTDGFTRYSDAMGRHQLQEVQIDPSKEPQAFITAVATVGWNDLARLEHLIQDLLD